MGAGQNTPSSPGPHPLGPRSQGLHSVHNWLRIKGPAPGLQGLGSAGAAYVRFMVWKIREICSMTGPVSGSFIHWVLFRGFSSMSSNAVGTEPGE